MRLFRGTVKLIKNLAQNYLSSARARPQGATGVYYKVNEDGDRGRKPRSTQMNCAIERTKRIWLRAGVLFTFCMAMAFSVGSLKADSSPRYDLAALVRRVQQNYPGVIAAQHAV